MPSPSPQIINVPLTRPVFNAVSPETGLPLANSFNVNIQVFGGDGQSSPLHPCLIDTGSCGLVVPAALFYKNGVVQGGTLLDGVTQGEAVTITYQPSSEDLTGFYYTIPNLAIGGSLTGVPAFVAQNVTVVGVTAPKNPGMGMMGVGFGRPKSYGDNILLKAPTYPSYLLTQNSITLGYSSATLPSGYGFQSLVQVPQAGEIITPFWQTPSANISIAPTGTSAPPFPGGTALLDTGINQMMLNAPYVGQTAWPKSLIDTTVQISWPGTGTDSILSYNFNVTGVGNASAADGGRPTFAVGGASPMKPSDLIALGTTPPPFVNTGIHVLLGANYFYDSQAGQIGFLKLST